MKKIKPFKLFSLLALLAVTLSSCASIGGSSSKPSSVDPTTSIDPTTTLDPTTSSDPTTSEHNEELLQIYNLYLENGGELSYEEWLESIKGDKGDPGTPGKDGTSLRTGHGAPSNDLGMVGDSYIDLDTWDFYVKYDSGWVKEGNIKGESGTQTVHTVTFDSNGGSKVESQNVLHGEKIVKPEDPTRWDAEFVCWTYMGEPWVFHGYTCTEDMTLVAKWNIIEEVPESISLIGNMPESNWEKDIEFSKNEIGDIWTLEKYPLYANQEFKIRKNNSWDTSWGYSSLDTASKDSFEEVSYNIKVLTTGVYSFTFNYDLEVLTVTKEDSNEWDNVYGLILGNHDNICAGEVETSTINGTTNETTYGTRYLYDLGNDDNGTFVKVTECTVYTDVINLYMQSKDGDWFAIREATHGTLYNINLADYDDLEWGAEYKILNNKFAVNGATGLLDLINDAYKKYPGSAVNLDVETNKWNISTTLEYIDENSSNSRIYEVLAEISLGNNFELLSINTTFTEYSDIVLDSNTGHYVVSENATILNTYIYNVSQTTGTRRITNHIDIDLYIYDSWELAHASYGDSYYSYVIGDIIDKDKTIVTDTATAVLVGLSNISPEIEISPIDEIKVEITNGDTSGLSTSVSKNYGVVTINPNTVGEYEVTISTKKVSQTIKIKVTETMGESITTNVYYASEGYYTADAIQNNGQSTYYVGTTIYIHSNVNPSEADQNITYEIVSGDENVEAELVNDFNKDGWGMTLTAYELKLNTTGSVVIKVSSVEYPDLATTFTLNVINAPTVEELFSYDYIVKDSIFTISTVEFTPSEEDVKVGTVRIGEIYDPSTSMSLTYTNYSYTYDETTKKFVLLDENGFETPTEMSFDDKYQLRYNWNVYTQQEKN